MRILTFDNVLLIGVVFFAVHSANWMAQGSVSPLHISGSGILIDEQTVFIKGSYIHLEVIDPKFKNISIPSKNIYIECNINSSNYHSSHSGTCQVQNEKR